MGQIVEVGKLGLRSNTKSADLPQENAKLITCLVGHQDCIDPSHSGQESRQTALS